MLVSWAVPKGVTLDPKARHLAVHVEDHPLDYEDFEGRDPRRRVRRRRRDRVGPRDVRARRRRRRAHRAREGRAPPRAHGEKIKGRVILIRTDREARQEQWLVLHKRDEHAVEGWDPEDHPRSVLSGRTNDEVKADPDRVWTREGGGADVPRAPAFDPPTDDELAALDALGAKGTWELQGRELALTNLDKVLFPGRGEEPPITKRDLIRYFASIGPVLLPYLAERPLNLQRFPDGVEQEGLLAEERAEVRTRLDPALAQRRRGYRRSRGVPRGRQRPRARVAREPRRGRAARVDVEGRRRRTTDVRAHRPRPRRGDDVGRPAHAGAVCIAPRSNTSACRASRRRRDNAGCRSGCRSRPGRRSPRRARGSSSCRARSPASRATS